MTNNNNQVNWDEIPEDVEAVVTYPITEDTFFKKVEGKLYSQLWRHHAYRESVWGGYSDVAGHFGDRFHLRPSPITQPTSEPPESTQVESSEVEDTTIPEFDWSSVEDDVDAVIVSPLGHLMAVLKECDGVLLIGNGRGIHRMYPTRRANKVDDYPVRQLQSGDGILIRRPPATTPPSEKVTCKVGFYGGELPEGMINLDDALKPSITPPEKSIPNQNGLSYYETHMKEFAKLHNEAYRKLLADEFPEYALTQSASGISSDLIGTPFSELKGILPFNHSKDIGLNAAYDIYKKVAAEVDKDGVGSKPSISTILQEAQQSILKHHGVTGKVKFTVTCS